MQWFTLRKEKGLRTRSEGSLTAEAALVLPVFLFSVLSLVYLFQLMSLQLKVQAALNQTVEQIASYGYLLDRVSAVAGKKAEKLLESTELFSEDGLLSVDEAGAWVMKLIHYAGGERAAKQLAGRYMDTEDGAFLHVADGWEGVSFRGSTLLDDTRCVEVTAEYQVKIPFVPAVFPMIRVKQTAVCRSFSSDRDYIPKESSEEKTETLYYMTPSGSVYHTTRECTYLKILTESATIENMTRMRNSSGGKYYPCKLCTEGLEVTGNVYYTSGGSSYHITKNCSSLSRKVMEKTAEEIAGIPPCSRCAPAQVVH